MLRKYSWYWTRIFQSADVAILAVCFLLVEQLSSRRELSDGLLTSIAAMAAIWLLTARLLALYRSKRMTGFLYELQLITIAMVFLYLTISNLSGLGLLPNLNWLAFALLGLVGISSFHAIVRQFLRYLRASGHNQRRTLIYGAGPVGQQVATEIIQRPWAGVRVVGFVDDSPELQNKLVDCADTGIPVIACCDAIRHVIVRNGIQELIIALPNSAHLSMVQAVLMLSDLNVNIRVVPDLFELAMSETRVEDLWGIPVIGIRQPAIDGFDAYMKRAMDFVVSAFLLVLLSPVLVLIAILIKLDSEGPVFFVQERIGENCKPFRMFKFRTMVRDAEARLDQLIQLDKLKQPSFKIHNDPRITRLGRFLRKTSLDELPQLINVLRGEMSLVGPRPEESRIVAMYDYLQRRRLAVKPGITGPMQVNGRGDLQFEQRLNLEVEYIKNYCLLDDIALLLRTIPAVLFGRGAH